MKYIFLIVFSSIWFTNSTFGQGSDEDALFIKKIHNAALTESKCYEWLTHLTNNIGGRLAGSPEAEEAVTYTHEIMQSLSLDSSFLQPCTVKKWTRGDREEAYMMLGGGKVPLNILALGNSIGTPNEGIFAPVIEVQSLDEVEALGEEKIKGKIVFYNRPMDPTQIRTFNAYGGAVDQRVYGAIKAAEYGGVAALVRSMTLRQDDYPHTGTMIYQDDIPQIPGIAISTNDANKLSKTLGGGPVEVFLKSNCAPGEEAVSYNVIGEIKGSEFPDEIILVGGHLDSWDVGGGAHDDGAGCVHALEVMHILKNLNYKPKRTIRCVMFMNEENGLAGGRTYAERSNENGEFHLAAIESDAGGFVPRGFSFDGDTSMFKTYYAAVSAFLSLMEPYGLQFTTGGSGADISPLKSQKGLLVGLRPDSQRYFDYHHTQIDQIEAVNKRELELGAAAMTSLVYLIDKYGLQ